jgi:endopeptidase Clp ATP-binding regulatory subunit ClpX
VAETAAAPELFSFNLKPSDISRYLDRFVIGQREAKKVLSVALCDHFQHVRMTLEGRPAPFYQKQNVLLLGPTGVGKTHLIRSAAELIGVPFVKADATKFSETGYVGGDVDDLVRDLVRRAGGDAKKAEHGIIYLDEVDKLATREPGSGRDVSGRGVQTNLLKLMEDGDVPLVSPNDVTGQLQSAMAAMRGGAGPGPETVSTRHILFIVSGAFSGIDRIVRNRVEAARERRSTSKGGAKSADATLTAGLEALIENLAAGERRERPGAAAVDRWHAQAGTSDFIAYGLEPEFVGRLPVRVACHGLDRDDLFAVLKRSESSLIHQYERAFAAYGIEVEFQDDGLRRLADLAAVEGTGARGLMTVCERVFRDLKFRLPSSRVRRFAVTAGLVEDPRAELKRLLAGAQAPG